MLLAIAVVAVGSLVQGLAGFGSSMLAAPVLALADPTLVPGPLLIVAALLTFLGALRERGHVDRSIVTWALLGRIPGVVLGAAVLAFVDDDALGLVFGAVILLGVAMSAVGYDLKLTNTSLAAAGAASGLMATTTSVGGPPMALVMHRHHPATTRATLSVFFFLGILMSLPAIASAGRLGRDEIVTGLILLAPAAVGFAASSPLRAVVDGPRLRPIILGLSALSATLLVVRSI